MSGARKKVVDVAFKASKKIGWDGMAKLIVSEEARKEFGSLHCAFDEVNTTLETKFSQEPEPIDWEYYRKGIGSRLVDMYKEAYDSEFTMLELAESVKEVVVTVIGGAIVDKAGRKPLILEFGGGGHKNASSFKLGSAVE